MPKKQIPITTKPTKRIAYADQILPRLEQLKIDLAAVGCDVRIEIAEIRIEVIELNDGKRTK